MHGVAVKQLTSCAQFEFVIVIIFVIGPEKTGLIYIKYIYSYYGTYLFFCMCMLAIYPIAVAS